MYAIVEACGRQYQLEAGRFIDIDLVPVEPGNEFVFERVLMIVNGKNSQVGTPYLLGAKVTGKVLSHGRDTKIIVYHMRPKKGTRKKQGHRQGFTRVLVNKISVNDQVLAEAKGKETVAKTKVQTTETGKTTPTSKEITAQTKVQSAEPSKGHKEKLETTSVKDKSQTETKVQAANKPKATAKQSESGVKAESKSEIKEKTITKAKKDKPES